MNNIIVIREGFLIKESPIQIDLITKGRAVIIAAFVGLGLMMLFIKLYADSFQTDLNKVTNQLQSVSVHDQNKLDKHATLDVEFFFQNPTSVAVTISTIDYELFANGNKLGEGHFTTQDIPEAGRPSLFGKSNVTLPDTFQLVDTDTISKEYSAITSNQPIKYEAKGQATIQSFLTEIIKDFDLHLG
jgi:LEA14-like dessication related protein